jgi:hypothetical protein
MLAVHLAVLEKETHLFEVGIHGRTGHMYVRLASK